jgi:hypothetical protein
MDHQAPASLTYFSFLRASLIREHQFVCVPEATVLSSNIDAGAATPSAFLYQLKLAGERNFECLG